MRIFVAYQLRVAETPLFKRFEDALLGYLVERDGRTARDRRAALLHHAAQPILVVGAIARKRDGDQVVLLVVADEVEHQRIRLAREFPQAAPELLHEHDGGFGLSQHDDLVQRRDIDALVHDIDRENVLQLAALKPLDGRIANRLGSVAVHGLRRVSALAKRLRQAARLVFAAAEHQAPTVALLDGILLDLSDDVIDARLAG